MLNYLVFRRLIITITFFIAFDVTGQNPVTINQPYDFLKWIKVKDSIRATRGYFDSTLMFPHGCGVPSGIASLRGGSRRMPALYYDTCGHKMYVFDPTDSTWSSAVANQNFANADLRFTGNRLHNAAGHGLTIDSLGSTYFFGRGTKFGNWQRVGIAFEPSSSLPFLISSATRNAANTADSLNVTIQPTGNSTLHISAANGVSNRMSRISLASAPAGTAKHYISLQTDSVVISAIPAATKDSVLAIGNYHASTNTNPIYKIPVSGLIGQNFANTDLRLTGNRAHNAANFTLGYDSVKTFSVIGKGLNFQGKKRYNWLYLDASNSQDINDFMYMRSVWRKGADDGDSLMHQITFTGNGGPRIENINYINSKISRVALQDGIVSLRGTGSGGSGIEMGTLGIATTSLDTVLIVGAWNSTQRTQPILKAAVADLFAGRATSWAQTNTITVSNTNTETSILGSGTGTLDIQPSTWFPGKSYEIEIRGTLGTDATTPAQTTFRIKLGSVTLCTTGGIFQGTNTTGREFSIKASFTCRATGASGTILATGIYNDDNEAINTLGDGTAVTINTTAMQSVGATIQYSTTGTGNTMNIYLVIFKSVN